jgi:hypothetical protein
MTNAEKVRENRARRAVARQGYRLVKIRRRDPRAVDYGKFLLMPPRGLGKGPLTIEQVESWVER